MMLSVVIPAHNEAGSLPSVLRDLHGTLFAAEVPHELLVVNDNSRDETESLLRDMEREISTLRHVNNAHPGGYGFAVRSGLEAARGGAVVIVMADGSDAPRDVVKFYRKLLEGYDCVFGSRFMPGSELVDYPRHKRVLNRVFNNAIRTLFGLRYNDVTNAFKMYRAEVIEGLKPFLSHHFNFTVELPLKAIVRGYSYAVVPNGWYNRKAGISKLKIKEMGSRYLFIVLYCFIEKWLGAGDYRKRGAGRP